MSISQAADELNLVPSAVSRQIKQLEKQLGVRLLERTTRSIALTSVGKHYLEKMNVLSEQARELQSMSDDNSDYAGHLRITAPLILGEHYLNDVIKRFVQHHPGVSISVLYLNRKVNLIEEGFDIAVRVGAIKESNLISRTIDDFSAILVASPEYFQKCGIPQHPKELVSHNCLINSQFETPRRWRFSHKGKSIFVKVEGRFEANDDAVLRSFACAGEGIAFLPIFYIKQFIESGELVPVLTDYLPKHLPISVVYPSRHFMSDAKRHLIESLINDAKLNSAFKPHDPENS